MGLPVPQENSNFPLKGSVRLSPHQNFPSLWPAISGFAMPEMSLFGNYDPHSPRLSLGKRSLAPIARSASHVLFPTASSRMAATKHDNGGDFLPHHLPWQVYFPITCWKLWLARNERIFKAHSQSQHSLVFSSVQAATKFYFLVGTTKRTSSACQMASAPIPLL